MKNLGHPQLGSINLNHLRIFESVYRHKNMTAASEELHMTQSGVSQHIKALESMLGVLLFDRIKKRIVPTQEAHLLSRRCVLGLSEIEYGLEEIRNQSKELSGVVSIGMPSEFGKSVILPLLSQFAVKNPKVKLKFTLGLAPNMGDMLINGDLDFALVDDFTLDRRILTRVVFEEVLGLYISKEALRPHLPLTEKLDAFEQIQFVEYEEGEPTLRLWFNHHFGAQRPKLNIHAMISDVQSLARLIELGLGAGVLPSHVVEKLDGKGKSLHCFGGSGKPLKNPIKIAHLEERSFSPAAGAAYKFLFEKLQGLLQGSKKVGAREPT